MRFVRRKWGWYFVLLSGEHYKVKLLRFHHRGRLSLQYHNKRSELWIFLSGNGGIQTDRIGTEHLVNAGDYYLAAVGEWHKYCAYKPTWVLEIQYGIKCEENDIVRI